MTTFEVTEARPEPAGEPRGLPHLRLESWMQEVPGLVAGITTAPFDMAIFGPGMTADVLPRWEVLREATGVRMTVHARQIHEATIRHTREVVPGMSVLPAADGHLTRTPGVLLTVSVADCVPVFLLDPGRRAVALLHAGWRGAAGGILEGGIRGLRDAFGTAAHDLRVHLGPSICGDCYEVGPEVFEALDQRPPPGPTPIDLRGVLADRARAAGVAHEAVSRSTHCTKCGGADLWSHRGGNPERQVAFLGFAG